MTSAQALPPSPWRAIARAALLVAGALGFTAGATLVALAVERGAERGDLAMVFLLGVLGAGAALGLWPALLCAAASGLTYNFLFLTPRLTLEIARGSDLLTFGVFFIAALATGWLSGRERDVARRAGRRAREVARLLEAGRRFSATLDETQVAAVCIEEIRALTGRDGVVLLGDEAPVDLPTEAQMAARWCAETREPTGAGSHTAPGVDWSFRPLGSARPAPGVAGMRAPADAAAARLFAGLADQAGTALERARLASAGVENETLRQTNALRVALLNSLSHDLRTPLAAVMGAVTTLLDFGPALDADATRDLLEGAREGSERLDRYLRELLDLSRLEGGALRPRAEWVDLRDVAAAAAQRIAPRLAGRELRREEPDVVAGAPLDPVLMEQALVNLLENALLHAPSPSPVRLRVELVEGAVCVAVEDEGPGVPHKEQAAVFEPFRRGDGRAAVQGSGLGLSIARGFVEAMGGTLTLESPLEHGRGARFVARFPTRVSAS